MTDRRTPRMAECQRCGQDIVGKTPLSRVCKECTMEGRRPASRNPRVTVWEVLMLIAAAAKAGKRCPPRNDTAMRRMIREGWIETRVYARNWRVAKILKGEFTGLETLASPCKGEEPWAISNADGVTMKRHPEPIAKTRARRAAPSKPRTLTGEEMKSLMRDIMR